METHIPAFPVPAHSLLDILAPKSEHDLNKSFQQLSESMIESTRLCCQTWFPSFHPTFLPLGAFRGKHYTWWFSIFQSHLYGKVLPLDSCVIACCQQSHFARVRSLRRHGQHWVWTYVLVNGCSPILVFPYYWHLCMVELKWSNVVKCIAWYYASMDCRKCIAKGWEID